MVKKGNKHDRGYIHFFIIFGVVFTILFLYLGKIIYTTSFNNTLYKILGGENDVRFQDHNECETTDS